MTEENFSIATRQQADPLFESDAPLGTNESRLSDVKRVSGYAKVAIFALSDQPFSISIMEAVSVDPAGNGNFGRTQAPIASVTVNGLEQIVMRIGPFGNFMKMVLSNVGVPQTFLEFLAQGLPVG